MEVLFATSNHHKVKEANLVAKDFDMEFVRVEEHYPEIRADDVRMVAEEGAKHIFRRVMKPVIVEDTGLFIKGLKGFPGPYSSFVFKRIGNEGILRLMQGIEDREAEFVSAIGYCDVALVSVFDGISRGAIGNEIRGNAGFGYDPIFIPGEGEKTFAEDPKLKARVSHRQRAFEKFCEFISQFRL